LQVDGHHRPHGTPAQGIRALKDASRGRLPDDRPTDVPCDPAEETATLAFWATAEKHKGLEERRAERGRPQKAEADLKEQSALRVGQEVLEW
jgi:uncharacterized protein (DUF4415 family)